MSTSLGVTLCEACANAHRQLTWSVSKLKSLRLDDFHDWQLDMVLGCLGNDVVNNIWEVSIPKGWSKPVPQDSADIKTQYVLAKYKWFAFVDEVRYNHAHLNLLPTLQFATMTYTKHKHPLRPILHQVRMQGDAHLAEGLADSCRDGLVPQCMWWISHVAHVNSCCDVKSGLTPLHHAVAHNRVHAVAFLVPCIHATMRTRLWQWQCGPHLTHFPHAHSPPPIP